MSNVDIIYRIKLSEERTELFRFPLDGETFDLKVRTVDNPPDWARLDYRQCSHCPLTVEEHPHCPLALQLHNIVERFDDTRSIDEVTVQVATEERKVVQKTSLQRVIASMLDLIYPICGCPKTAFMKPLARFHLPLCSEEETVFRVTGMYLLAQYFLSRSPARGGRIEFDGLTQIYNDLHTLNTAVASRLQSATQSDSSKNAITLLDMYSTLVPLLLEDELAEMRGFFQAYLPVDEEKPVVTTGYLEKAKAFSFDLENVGLVPTEEEEQQQKQDDLPDWLKQAKGIEDAPKPKASFGEPEAAAEKPKEEKKEEKPFTTKDGLTLELTPLEEKTRDEE